MNHRPCHLIYRNVERLINRLVPQDQEKYEHNDEGMDDLSAHIKARLLGCQLSLPIQNGILALGVCKAFIWKIPNHPKQMLTTLQGA